MVSVHFPERASRRESDIHPNWLTEESRISVGVFPTNFLARDLKSRQRALRMPALTRENMRERFGKRIMRPYSGDYQAKFARIRTAMHKLIGRIGHARCYVIWRQARQTLPHAAAGGLSGSFHSFLRILFRAVTTLSV
jgi:hypothetical protein